MMPADLGLEDRAERLLVVRDPARVRDALAARYRACRVTTADTYLGGIAAAAKAPVRAMLVGVDPACRRFDAAVAGLREACGTTTRLVLCTEPAFEPLARTALAAGADDYVICPPAGDELDAALGLPAPAPLPPSAGATFAAEELAAVGTLLRHVGEGAGAVLEPLAAHLRNCLRAGGVRVVVDHLTGQAGVTDGPPVLIEPLLREGAAVGQIELWPAQAGPFRPDDAVKLGHYARLVEGMLDLAARQQQWQRLAYLDDLTGLPNRRYLLAFLDRQLAKAAAERSRVTFLLFDIDNFKRYNDEFGHDVGDQIIRDTGQLFRANCRPHDLVARYGGDEFGVVFWDAEVPRVAGSQHPDSPRTVLARFRKALETHECAALGPGAAGVLTISGGLATFPWDTQSRDELIHKADQALLDAKRQGKNRINLIGG